MPIIKSTADQDRLAQVQRAVRGLRRLRARIARRGFKPLTDGEILSAARLGVESITITLGREDDGRWWADIESMPGVMAYGATREEAISAVRALALRIAADCIDHGEAVPEPFGKVFSIA